MNWRVNTVKVFVEELKKLLEVNKNSLKEFKVVERYKFMDLLIIKFINF